MVERRVLYGKHSYPIESPTLCGGGGRGGVGGWGELFSANGAAGFFYHLAIIA